MTEENSARRGIGNGLFDLIDIVDKVCGICADARKVLDTDGRVAVEVFTANCYSRDDLGQVRSVLLDCTGKCCDFVVEDRLSGGRPQCEEQCRVGGDSGRDRLGGTVCRAGLDHGVQPSTCESGRANEILRRGEQVLKIRLGNRRAVRVGRTIVEALVDCGNERQSRKQKGEHNDGERIERGDTTSRCNQKGMKDDE